MMYFASFLVSSVIVYVECSDDRAAMHDATTERFQSSNESKRQIDKTEPKTASSSAKILSIIDYHHFL
jgi:hypothetical protein